MALCTEMLIITYLKVKKIKITTEISTSYCPLKTYDISLLALKMIFLALKKIRFKNTVRK